MTKQYEFYSRLEYFAELKQRISKTIAGDRVSLGSMKLRPSVPEIKEVLDELTAAADRGVSVDLAIDAYSFLMGDHLRPGPLFIYGKLPQRLPDFFRKQIETLEKLKKAGGNYGIVNPPARPLSLPFAGRSHLKFAIINNRLYLGGCNLGSADRLDMMVAWEDQEAADWLYRLAHKILIARNTRHVTGGHDIVHTLKDGSQLMFDCGKPKQSIIFRKALELIDQAQKSVFIACQYFPNSITLKHLVAAHQRGVEVTIIYNHPSKHGSFYSTLHHMVVLRERIRAPAQLFKGRLHKDIPFLHAKLITTEKATVIGSHNYVAAGVNFGTAEIAFLKHDPVFAQHALYNIKRQYEPALRDDY